MVEVRIELIRDER